ncbi:PLP-dependent aminotransferase family protein [Shewanella khirikhana]|uniref:HTH-type transcriptional regulator YjiR n=1 Tax=Shewanella khirikhana TaxID=1965282 RepID=A0ABM8HJS7_9GAMM|nr:PLP-dependent aminotransferase family protein [Shewanella khirikhana]AZQ13126.1 putative HTH-type transcriptional regulator YjiR [Shewanella khirikhana]
MKKYQQVAEAIARQIREGRYGLGERLPSVREVCGRFGISMSTAQAAFRLLEDQALAQARPGAGFYVSFRGTPQVPGEGPARYEVHNRMLQVLSWCAQPGITDLGTAVLSPGLLPRAALSKLLARQARFEMATVLQPLFSGGHPPLRREIAKRLILQGIELGESEVLVTGGCQDAISLALSAIAHAGDTIAVESPCFPGLLQVIESLGMKVLEIPCSPGQGLSVEALQLALARWQVAALVLCPDFSNPTGSQMPLANRQRLLALAGEHDLAIIEDDLFSELQEPGKGIPALKALDTDGRVIYCSSVAKSLGSGLRLGWLCGGRYHGDIAKLKAFRNVSEPLIIQALVAEFMASGGYGRHLGSLGKRLQLNLKKLRGWVEQAFPGQTQIGRPEGGFVLWVSLPGIDSGRLLSLAVAEGVAFFPGDVFSGAGQYNHCLRLSGAFDDDDKTQKAVAVLGRLAHSLL